MVLVGIALGSNLGDRSGELDAAMIFLRKIATHDVKESMRMETVPENCPPNAPLFLNSVALMEIDPERLPVRELLAQLQKYEQARGRIPLSQRVLNAPRPVDLDILFYGDCIVQESYLILPHPRALQRAFVLAPLASLRPNLCWPGSSKTVAELLHQLSELG